MREIVAGSCVRAAPAKRNIVGETGEKIEAAQAGVGAFRDEDLGPQTARAVITIRSSIPSRVAPSIGPSCADRARNPGGSLSSLLVAPRKRLNVSIEQVSAPSIAHKDRVFASGRSPRALDQRTSAPCPMSLEGWPRHTG